MQNVAAEFTIGRKKTIGTDFSISRNNPIETNFIIKASPTKVSQLENDLNFQTETQVQEAITEATDVFVFTQGIASAEWIINHNFGKQISAVMVVNSANEIVIPNEIEIVDDNVVRIEFLAEFAGKAYIR